MLARNMRRMIVSLVCAAIPMYGGLASIAFGDSKCAEKTTCPKTSKCSFCSWLSGKCDKTTCPKEAKVECKTECKTKCSLCDRLAGKCPKKCETNGVYGYREPSPSGAADLPANAAPGDCFAKTVIPAEYTTMTERHMIQEASERLEVVPAQYKWVEERVMVKECSTQLEAVPAEYKWTEKRIEVKPAHTGWVLQRAADCDLPEGKEVVGDIFCLRTTPAEYRTIRTQCLAKAACTRQITIPAEYQTIRRQVVACPATTRKVCIPAQYENIQRTVMVCPERVKWERVVCEDRLTKDTVNKVKTALATAGFKPGPQDGKLSSADWAALTAFQQKNKIGVGQMTYDTLKLLGVTVQ